ncbi:MAG: phospho-N-acetylmuramoyl-pentapeptide-transferase [bacterium]
MIIIGLIGLLSILSFWAYDYYVKRVKVGQYIREDAPYHHKSKQGTPTAGGIIFSLCIVALSLVINYLQPLPLYSLFIVLTLGSLGIGFYDDLMKILNKRNLGLRARDKLFLQLLISTVAWFILYMNNQYFIDKFGCGFTTLIFADKSIDLGWFYLIFLFVFFSGTTNATNLTDGLDGLLASVSLSTFLAFVTIFLIDPVLFSSNIIYLLLGIICFISIFLYYNFPKAKIFMGDAGSMTIGSLFVYFCIVSKTEPYFLFLGYIYFLVALSVILQVLYFKFTNGKRLFNITPLHHHFELMGYNEKAILLRFNLVNSIFIFVGLFLWLYKFIRGGI